MMICVFGNRKKRTRVEFSGKVPGGGRQGSRRAGALFFSACLAGVCLGGERGTGAGRGAVPEEDGFPGGFGSAARPGLEGEVFAGWESRYLTEGRDALRGGSLFVAGAELSWEGLMARVWRGHAAGGGYGEWKFSLGLEKEVGDFGFSTGFTHLRFPGTGKHDNRVSAGVSWSGLPWKVGLGAEAYYSFEAGGWFGEVSAGRGFAVTDRLGLEVSAALGVNQGFVADGHDGANHWALRLGAEYEVSESLAVTAHAEYSWELGRDGALPGDQTLGNIFRWGTGLRWSF